ncbi:MAG: hypothetical protein Kow0056_01990 [Coriobacteriia bacterium]
MVREASAIELGERCGTPPPEVTIVGTTMLARSIAVTINKVVVSKRRLRVAWSLSMALSRLAAWMRRGYVAGACGIVFRYILRSLRSFPVTVLSSCSDATSRV